MVENEDGQEKIEDVIVKKEQEVKEKGQVVCFKELGSVVVIMCGVVGIIMFGSMLYDIGWEVFELNYQIFWDELMSFDVMLGNLIVFVKLVFLVFVLFYILVFVVVLFVLLLVGGFNFFIKVLVFKFNKLNLFSGFKCMFLVQVLMEMIKVIVKFLLVGIFVILIMQYDWDCYLVLGF